MSLAIEKIALSVKLAKKNSKDKIENTPPRN
jgi:hypothetical protein